MKTAAASRPSDALIAEHNAILADAAALAGRSVDSLADALRVVSRAARTVANLNLRVPDATLRLLSRIEAVVLEIAPRDIPVDSLSVSVCIGGLLPVGFNRCGFDYVLGPTRTQYMRAIVEGL